MIETGRAGWFRRTLILPAGGARDGVDGLVSLFAAIAILALLAIPVALLGGIAYWLTGSSGATYAVVVATALIVVVTASSTAVHWLKIDTTGLVFGRVAGTPKAIRWEDVVSIRPASRKEVVLNGWLWPPLPPREATRCTSSLGHFRIDYAGGYIYFPPSDAEEFMGAVAYWRSGHQNDATSNHIPPPAS